MTYSRVLVIGMDGLDPSLAASMMAAGQLPHLAALRQSGVYTQVASTWPAQTPVAWSTFAVGANPGFHGIFDFLRRDPATYLPEIGLYRHEQKSRFLPPRAVNLRRGTPVWEHLSDAGIPSTVLRHPCTYPPRSFRGRLLSGIGVPDVRGGFGSSTFFTTDDRPTGGEGEKVVKVEADRQGHAALFLPGPRVSQRGELTLELQLLLERGEDAVEIRSPSGGFSVQLERARWSPWLHVRFKQGILQTIHGLVRFYLDGTDPLALFASPVHFDPDHPLFPISHPWDYAAELRAAIGPFATLGIAEEHNGLTNERFDESAYLAQCLDVMQERRAMMHHELERFDEGFFYCLFATPDRIQHMFWRFREPEHPANGGAPTDPDLTRVIEDHYQRCDEIVGEALQYAGPDTLFVVLSDHGFTSFRREVELNRWLHDQGYLVLKPGVEPGKGAGDLLREVDWGRTRAYGLGLAGLYLNLRGREAEGWVGASEAEGLKAEIAAGLSGLRDPGDGAVAVREVHPREALYSGPFVEEAPDLIVGCAPGYRVASGSAMGGIGAAVVKDNLRRWSGDHVVHPAAVPGVLFMNMPFRDRSARLRDLAPTILEALGVPTKEGLEGRSLLT